MTVEKSLQEKWKQMNDFLQKDFRFKILPNWSHNIHKSGI